MNWKESVYSLMRDGGGEGIDRSEKEKRRQRRGFLNSVYESQINPEPHVWRADTNQGCKFLGN